MVLETSANFPPGPLAPWLQELNGFGRGSVCFLDELLCWSGPQMNGSELLPNERVRTFPRGTYVQLD